MTAPNQIQYIPITTFTIDDTLPDILIPPGSFVTVLISATNVSGSSPTLIVGLRGRTKDGTLILLVDAPTISGGATRTAQFENCPDTIFIFINLSGTSPSFDVEIDLIITPPASYAA